MNLSTIKKFAVKICWALLFLALPVTSFPYFPGEIGGKTLVRPLALYPLVILVCLVTIPRMLKRPLPKTFLPLLAFIIVATISSTVSFASDLDSLRGVSAASRLLRNMITLGIGVAFYFTFTLLHENWDDLKLSLRWLYVGFALALSWGSLQALYVIHFSPRYFAILNRLQTFISSRKLFTTRISGMTYEPKWFAEQICFLLFPWLLGSVLTRRSQFSWRYKWITVELILLVWAAVILVFTFSRTGLFILIGLTVLAFIFFRHDILDRRYRIREQKESGIQPVKSTRRIWRQKKGYIILEAALIASILMAVLFVIGSQNPYFSRFWRYFTEAKKRNRTYLEFIAVEQRFIYLETGLRMFSDYPLLGVGLGNYAFYFDQSLPDQLYSQQPEIIRQTTPVEGRDRLITPKNLLARLLAETGFLGTSTFLTFILAIVGCTVYLLRFSPVAKQPDLSRASEQRFWGMSAFLSLMVFSVIIFSFDSFALPNMWVVFGLITAAAHIPERAQLASGVGDLSNPTAPDLMPAEHVP
jgi:O-Antigen ligase